MLGLQAAPGVRWWERQGGGPSRRLFFHTGHQGSFLPGWFPPQQVSSGPVCTEGRAVTERSVVKEWQ